MRVNNKFDAIQHDDVDASAPGPTTSAAPVSANLELTMYVVLCVEPIETTEQNQPIELSKFHGNHMKPTQPGPYTTDTGYKLTGTQETWTMHRHTLARWRLATDHVIDIMLGVFGINVDAARGTMA